MVKVRKFNDSDVEELTAINRRLGKFPFPDLANPLYIIKGTAVDGTDKIVGGGFVKLTAEVIVILDPKCSRRVRAEALRELFLVGKMESFKAGIPSWHAFIKGNEGFIRALMKSFGFIKIDDDVLYLNLEG